MEGSPPVAAEWTPDGRASEPFVFRSGGLFGSGKKIHTIRAAVEHMDRHPEDGIYHLQNGTLAGWLESQDADELARLSQQVVVEGFTDPRVMLETFLLGTGLVRRPRLLLRPKALRMGYILAGQSCAHDLQIRKGRGRGYLFGRLHRDVPWLSLDPTTFGGSSSRFSVSVDTRTLPIGVAAQEAQIAVESSASEQPVMVPVSFRVMGMPSQFNRFVLRPLANLLVGGLLGAGLGWLLGRSGVGLPGWLPAEQLARAPSMWALLIGTLWALLAGVRGLLQPVAWPLLYTLGRWLLRTLIWTVTLVLIATVILWLWWQLHLDLGLRPPPAWPSALIGAFALAVLPGVLGELWNTRSARDPSSVSGRMPVLKPGIMIASAAVICALLLTGIRFATPALQRYDAAAALGSAQEWTNQRLAQLDSILNHWIDQFYLRIYDRRAPVKPAPTTTTSPPVTPLPAATNTP